MKQLYIDVIQKYKTYALEAKIAIPGNNGPYFQKETYARNTAHWIITFSYMYRKTRDSSYAAIIRRFADSLIDDIISSPHGVVRCFCPGEKSSVNGLIGFAWIIEGLTAAYQVLQDQRILDAAEKLFMSQPYDIHLHTWKVVDIEGKNLGTDIAFNHSLWFCLSGAKLLHERKNDKIDSQVKDYLRYVGKHFLIYSNGLISHFDVHGDSWKSNLKTRIKKLICSFTGKGLPWRNWNTVEYERSYHLFSAYAFALLYLLYPETIFFNSRKFQKVKTYALDICHFMKFDQMNAYAYGYNSPAYELPLVEFVFGNGEDQEDENECFKQHIEYNLHTSAMEYTSNVSDKETLNARIYEIIQYYGLKEGLGNEGNK